MILFMKKISKREKSLIATAFGAIALFLIYQCAINPFLKYTVRIQEEIPQMKGDLLTARRIQTRYRELDGEIRRVRQHIDQRTAEFSPNDFLSTLAKKAGIFPNLDGIKPDHTKINESYGEDTATVKLKNVQLEKLVNYLYDIESSGQLLTVKELSIKPDNDNSLALEVTFDVSTFTRTKKTDEGTVGKPPSKPQHTQRPRRR
jgi:type II secretory pathway component PulM